MAATASKTKEAPAILIVRESFVVDVDGVPTAYRKGEPVDPTDPVLRRQPESRFEPLVFPHPVRRAHMSAPEPRT